MAGSHVLQTKAGMHHLTRTRRQARPDWGTLVIFTEFPPTLLTYRKRASLRARLVSMISFSAESCPFLSSNTPTPPKIRSALGEGVGDSLREQDGYCQGSRTNLPAGFSAVFHHLPFSSLIEQLIVVDIFHRGKLTPSSGWPMKFKKKAGRDDCLATSYQLSQTQPRRSPYQDFAMPAPSQPRQSVQSQDQKSALLPRHPVLFSLSPFSFPSPHHLSSSPITHLLLLHHLFRIA